MSLIAKEIMKKEVVTINENSSVYEAIEVLVSRNISCLPIIDDEGNVKGIVSETDLVYVDKKLNPSSYYAYSNVNVPVDTRILQKDISRLKTLGIKEVMTKKVLTIQEDTPLENIIDIIINKGIKTIPVVKDAKIIGIVTRKYILKYYIE
ncbi:MAG: CBS domain-containing protein [Clostridiaceae bacterium]|nr:CBS domain-containing protein [Clostridiaceae bacterium]